MLDALLMQLQPELDSIKQVNKEVDVKAIAAVMSTGIMMLSFLSDLNYPLLGIDLNSDPGWLRIEKVLNLLLVDF